MQFATSEDKVVSKLYIEDFDWSKNQDSKDFEVAVTSMQLFVEKFRSLVNENKTLDDSMASTASNGKRTLDDSTSSTSTSTSSILDSPSSLVSPPPSKKKKSKPTEKSETMDEFYQKLKDAGKMASGLFIFLSL